MKFTHNGFTIVCTPTGQFTCKTPTGVIKSRSLDGMRKQLDKTAPFKPFRAFIWGWVYTSASHFGRHKWVNVEIVGTYRDGPNRRLWVDASGKKHREVFAESEANRKLAREWQAEVRAADRMRRRNNKLVKIALDHCEQVRP